MKGMENVSSAAAMATGLNQLLLFRKEPAPPQKFSLAMIAALADASRAIPIELQ